MPDPRGKTVTELLAEFEKSPEGGARITRLQEQITNLVSTRSQRVFEIGPKAPPFRCGVLSCTHLGSLYEEIGITKAIYEWFAQEGVKVVFHCGDMTEGVQMRKGHEHSIHKHGADAQRKWTIEQYPFIKGITTYLIAGNHDAAHMKSGGTDICAGIAESREDIIYLGADTGRFIVDRTGERQIVVDMIHPDGGSSYAISYKCQKIIESLDSGSKPDVLLIGHFHKAFTLPAYRNVAAIMAGCTQRQTDFMARNGLAAHVGAHILECRNLDGQFVLGSTWRGFRPA